MRKTSIAALVLLLSTVSSIVGETMPDPHDGTLSPGERLTALVDRMRIEHQRLESLQANFVQRKESLLLLEPSQAQGVFSYAAPDRVRWEYLSPDPITLLITQDQMVTWYRDLQRADTADVSDQSRRVLDYLSASTSIDRLMKYFKVSLRIPGDPSLPLRLEMTPLYTRVARRVRELEIWIDGTHYLPIKLRYVEGDGDVTEYEFTDLRVNEELPAGRFQLDIPDDVEVHTVQLGSRASGS